MLCPLMSSMQTFLLQLRSQHIPTYSKLSMKVAQGLAVCSRLDCSESTLDAGQTPAVQATTPTPAATETPLSSSALTPTIVPRTSAGAHANITRPVLIFTTLKGLEAPLHPWHAFAFSHEMCSSE